ncbi:hypothetical protein NDU88_002795 [Pleurodeles waltl]|uniref:Reverse transcriptase n=1 Tax=Pleurodeles waltl TaxID=8319 RepID=A0AAV7W2W1_PLEWA|nr:hypothetical protein NDU88_002795 [Pleurodeles waltl]
MGSSQLQIIHVADDIVIMHYKKIRLQQALNALNTFSKANQLQVNQENTKILIFGRFKNKKRINWQLGSQIVHTARKYNNLGVWFTENNTVGAQKNAIRHKAAAITYKLAKLNNQLRSASAAPILRVTKATLLLALQYGYLAFPGSLECTIEQTHCRAYLKSLPKPKYTLCTRLRLEMGLKSQRIDCQAAILKYYISLRKANPLTLKDHLRMIFETPGKPWYTQLSKAQKTFEMGDSIQLSDTVIYNVWKTMINKRAKELSRESDLLLIKSPTTVPALNDSYLVGAPQPYLLAAINAGTLHQILCMRTLVLPIQDFNPSWSAHRQKSACRVCSYQQESWLHLLCCCTRLAAERRQLIIPLVLAQGARSCMEVSNLCFSHSVPWALTRCAKYVTALRRLLAQATGTDNRALLIMCKHSLVANETVRRQFY